MQPLGCAHCIYSCAATAHPPAVDQHCGLLLRERLGRDSPDAACGSGDQEHLISKALPCRRTVEAQTRAHMPGSEAAWRRVVQLRAEMPQSLKHRISEPARLHRAKQLR